MLYSSFFFHESCLSLLGDDRHLTTEWGKRESVRSIILLSWCLCFGVSNACKGGGGGVTLIPLPQLRSLFCTESQFRPLCFSFCFSNKKTLLALCFAVKLTLSHCAYDSQRESVSSHSSLSPADIHEEQISIPFPVSQGWKVWGSILQYQFYFCQFPKGVEFVAPPHASKNSQGRRIQVYFFAFLQQLLFWTHIHAIIKASKGISPGTFVIPGDIHGEIWDLVLYLLLPSSSVLWSLGRRICF